MRVIVIGLGSMGRRRIRLIQKYDATIAVVGVDLNRERCQRAIEELGIEACGDLQHALDRAVYTCAFVTTSPLSHSEIIETCLSRGLHVFTELNLVSNGYAKNQELAEQKGLTLFLSSTFLYRREVSYIKEAVGRQDGPFAYRYHVGQYLPDWHPWEDYRNFFIGKKESNGCRELLAIELPWLTEVFGEVVDFQVIRQRITRLDIDYDDTYLLLLRHGANHTGMLMIDVVSPKAVRQFEMIGERVHLEWNGRPDGLSVYCPEKKEEQPVFLYEEVDHLAGYSANIIENAYYEEVRNFFETIAGRETAKYSFAQDEKILDLIGRIEVE